MFTLEFYGYDDTGTMFRMPSAHVRYPSIDRARSAADSALKMIREIEVIQLHKVGGGGAALEVIRRSDLDITDRGQDDHL